MFYVLNSAPESQSDELFVAPNGIGCVKMVIKANINP